MDPATTTLLIKMAGELGMLLVQTLRATKEPQLATAATEIERVLTHADEQLQSVVVRARAELAKQGVR